MGYHTTDSKTVHHPNLGPVTVDCDTLTVPGSDLRIAACTAPPGTTTSEQFALLATIGTQPMPHPINTSTAPGIDLGQAHRSG